MSDVDWDDAVAQYLANVPLRDIAARHGVSHVTIMRYMDKHGIKRGRKKKASRKRTKSTRTKSTKHIELVTASPEPDLLPAATNRGAPTIRTEELVNRILQGIADGYSTAAVCEMVGISRQTLCNWMQDDRDLLDRYARAKALCADLYAEQIIEIADDSSQDRTVNKKGEEIINREFVQRSHLRMEARKWYAARVAPTKYGDRGSSIVEGADLTPRRRIRIAFVTSDGQVVTPGQAGNQNVVPIRGE